MKRNKILAVMLLLCVLLMELTACKKYLDEKPDQKLATIETLQDMQALLDNFPNNNMNDPGVCNGVSDDTYVTDEVYNARTADEQNLYLWKGDHVFGKRESQWENAYELVYIANSVLDAVESNGANITDKSELAHVKAQALFLRAREFLAVLSIWANTYDGGNAGSELGIPLRLSADFNIPSVRATLAESYAQVISDFKNAIPALPSKAVSSVRPSKAAAYGMLSRTYLQMRNYTAAGLYADSALAIQSTLLDYNSLTASASFPIARQNAEVVFDTRGVAIATNTQARGLIVPELYNLYNANDLRKTVFFKASGTAYVFKGYYAGAAAQFDGIATDELLLTRAECKARENKIADALADLNLLLVNRYKKGTFTAWQTMAQADLLKLIKTERRKELLFRTLRWPDIKRWNKEGDGIVLSRTINGVTTTLQPNSLLYALAIPEDVIELTGMIQNPR